MQRQRLPWKATSKALIGGPSGGDWRRSVYIDMMMPGVQKPHWLPWALARRSWAGWRRVRVLPIPSTVVTAHPCIAHTGIRQAFTGRCFTLPVRRSMRDNIMVQAPQPPSPQPNFVPQRNSFSLKYVSSVHSGSGLGSMTYDNNNSILSGLNSILIMKN